MIIFIMICLPNISTKIIHKITQYSRYKQQETINHRKKFMWNQEKNAWFSTLRREFFKYLDFF